MSILNRQTRTIPPKNNEIDFVIKPIIFFIPYGGQFNVKMRHHFYFLVLIVVSLTMLLKFNLATLVINEHQIKEASKINENTLSHISNNVEQRMPSSPSIICGDENNSMKRSCASWIPREKRKVLFVELYTWDHYYGRGKYKTGEYYTSASWDYALRSLGFEVDRVSTRYYYEEMTMEEMTKYHRIFMRDPKAHKYYKYHDLLCRVRPMHFYGGWYHQKDESNYRFDFPFDPKQIVVAYPDDQNSFLGYFPHNLLDMNVPDANRGKVGLLLGKKPEYFDGYQDVIIALINAGFELHTTCQDSATAKCTFPPEVIRHTNVGPDEYARLMQNFSFMLGFKNPTGSPSPIVGLSHGVAFLNPLLESKGRDVQHKALSRIGMPYSYNVDLNDSEGVVRAATWASIYRFSSYVPPEFRVESMIDRMCSVLEDEALCLCPNPEFGGAELDWRTDHYPINESIDCRASSTIKKQGIFSPR